MSTISTPATVPFQRVLDALLAEDTPLNPRYLYRFSDMEKSDLERLKSIWGKIPAWRRQAMMEDVEELNKKDTLLNFVEFSKFALQDENEKIRLSAIRTLGDYDENSLIPVLLHLLETDKVSDVRAAAAGALGNFVYTGELGLVPTSLMLAVENALLNAINSDEAACIRCAALEALGYSEREEVPALIEIAYASDDPHWKASALLAMGHSANDDWRPQILSMLNNKLPTLRRQAARAAGELEITDAVPTLIDLLDDTDDETRNASIWSLSQIGGGEARETLEKMLDEAEVERDIDFLESALDNLSFTEDLQLMPLFDFPEMNEEDVDGNDLDELSDDFEDDEDSDD
jgi:HEAT repeat protein